MSNAERAENLLEIIPRAKPKFELLAKMHGSVDFETESRYAWQALQNNDYLMGLALSNIDAFMQAVCNIAAVGLSLNPVLAHGYLVPRDKKVMFIPSYRGLVHLAVSGGAIRWVKSELVYEKDELILRGVDKAPEHKSNVFQPRGSIVGVYCVAKTIDGDYITETMTIAEVYKVRDRSESWKAGKGSPWKSDESEMIKKTVIRRAYKSWPMTTGRARLEQAIEADVSSDPIDVSPLPEQPENQNHIDESIKEMREMLAELGREESAYIEYLCRTTKRTIEKLEDLTEHEMSFNMVMLNQWVEQEREKVANATNK